MSRSPYDDPRRTAYLDLVCNTLAPNHLAGQVGELLAGLNGRLGGRRYVKVLRLVREKRRGELPELVWVRLEDLQHEVSVRFPVKNAAIDRERTARAASWVSVELACHG